MSDHEPPIQWFPGHMAATLRRMETYLAAVDVIIEVIDARLPRLSANPALAEIAARRPWIRVFSRVDLADPTITAAWVASARTPERASMAIDGRQKGDLNQLVARVERMVDKIGTVRAMIVGIPNAGKSTVINGLVGRTVARVENRAGVTKSLQWFRVSKRMELLDSPGVFVPKIATETGQWMLALTGALPRERYDARAVIGRFHAYWLKRRGTAGIPSAELPTLQEFARARGFLRKGGELDLENATLQYLKVFNEAGFGRYSFEQPDSVEPLPEPAESEGA
jgi:ribosome biogenesis GTPase A